MIGYCFEPQSAKRFVDAYTTRAYTSLFEGVWAFGAILNLQGRVVSLIALLKLNDGSVEMLWPRSLHSVEVFLKPYLKINRFVFKRIESASSIELIWPPGAPLFFDDHWVGVFTAHDLSLDLWQWIEWTKGCYLGQEIALRVQMKTQIHKKRLAILFNDTLDKSSISILYSLVQYTVAVMQRCDWEQQGVAYVWDRSYQKNTIPPHMLSVDIFTKTEPMPK